MLTLRTTVARASIGAALLATAWVAWALATLPPRAGHGALRADAQGRRIVRGVYHVHTRNSDGSGTVADVAAAAARAGLEFVVVTDHHDASGPERPAAYYGDVLVIQAAEVSAAPGHYVTLDLPRAPYPLGGDPRDLVEDVRRLGGFGVAAHPDSPKVGLRWTDWSAPVDAMEWFNADTAWRAASWPAVLRVIPQYPFRPAEAVASLFVRPSATLARWDAMTRTRRVVGIAGSDAHARLGFSETGDPIRRGTSLPLPSYDAVFRALSLSVELDTSLTRRAVEDGARLMAAIRAGHVYTVIDALRSPGALRFEGRSGTAVAGEGDVLPVNGAVRLRAETDAPPGSVLALIENGQVIRTTQDQVLEWERQTTAEAPPFSATYRVEVRVAGKTSDADIPWIVSNPIYAGLAWSPQAAPEPPPASGPGGRLDPGGEWRIEKDSGSDASMTSGSASAPAMRFTLGQAPSAYVALAGGVTEGLRGAGRLIFTGRSDRPMRLSIQLRAPTAGAGDRWQRSVYLDTQPRQIVVALDDMRPIGSTPSAHPERLAIDSLLFVVDTTHARQGSSAAFWLSGLRVER